MVATWWMICSLKSCRKDPGFKGLFPAHCSPYPSGSVQRSREMRGKVPHPRASFGPWTSPPACPPTLRLTSEAMLKSRDQ